jgi:hypothetical protein
MSTDEFEVCRVGRRSRDERRNLAKRQVQVKGLSRTHSVESPEFSSRLVGGAVERRIFRATFETVRSEKRVHLSVLLSTLNCIALPSEMTVKQA